MRNHGAHTSASRKGMAIPMLLKPRADFQWGDKRCAPELEDVVKKVGFSSADRPTLFLLYYSGENRLHSLSVT